MKKTSVVCFKWNDDYYLQLRFDDEQHDIPEDSERIFVIEEEGGTLSSTEKVYRKAHDTAKSMGIDVPGL